MKNLFILAIFPVLILTGCHSVKTCNYTQSKSLYYVASREKKTADFPAQNSLLVFVTGSTPPVSFSFFSRSSADFKATAKIDKGAFAAFLAAPGDYVFQQRTGFSVKLGEIVIFQCSEKETKKISTDEFKQKFSSKNLSEECSGTDQIIPASLKVPDLVGGWERFEYYTGKTIGMAIVSPFYVLYGACFVIGFVAKAAMKSGDACYMIVGALFYAFTFWAVPNDVKESIAAEGVPYSTKKNASGMSFVPVNTSNPGTYGPGIYQDQYGRPVKYEVKNGVPGEQIQIKHDAYGPGIGMDQYGRPVRTSPAF